MRRHDGVGDRACHKTIRLSRVGPFRRATGRRRLRPETIDTGNVRANVYREMNAMIKLTRRTALATLAAVPLARPAILRAQSTSKPIKIGLLSDMNGPYRANGGPGNKHAAE